MKNISVLYLKLYRCEEKNMEKKWIKYYVIIGIFLKLTQSIFYPISNVLFLVFLCSVFYALLKTIVHTRKRDIELPVRTVITLILLLVLCFFPTYNQMEKARFYILEKKYVQLADELEDEILKKDNTEGEYLNIDFKYKYLTRKTDSVFYRKENNSIIIGFDISSNFFQDMILFMCQMNQKWNK